MADEKPRGFPGEALLIRLVETAEKGGGGIFKHFVEPLLKLNQAQAERRAKLVDAQAAREQEELKAGLKTLAELDPQISFRSTVPAIPFFSSSGPIQIDQGAIDYFSRLNAEEAIRAEFNVANALGHTAEALKDDPTPPPPEFVDDDWLRRWRESASKTSKEELQQLWGRMLAGEIKSPGAFSLSTVDFMRNLSTRDAKVIQSVLNFAIGDFIWRASPLDVIQRYGLHFNEMLEARDIGVVDSVESGLASSFAPAGDPLRVILKSHGTAVVVFLSDVSEIVSTQIIPLTRVGRELLQLGSFEVQPDYVEDFAKSLVAANRKVEIGRVADGYIVDRRTVVTN